MALTRPKFTQINTTISEITDPISVLNQGSNLANVDIGLLMNRNNGSTSNVAFYWSESGNTFVAGWTNNTGVSNSNISITDYANLKVNNIYGNIGGGNSQANVFITGSLIPSANLSYDLGSNTKRFNTLWLSGTTINLGGETVKFQNGNWEFTTAGGPTIYLGNLSSFTNLTSSNVTFTGGYADNLKLGPNIAASANVTTLTVNDNTNTSGLGTGALIVSSGGAAIQKDLYVGGNIYVSNLISQTSSILQVNEPLVYLEAADAPSYNYEIGIYSNFIGGPLNNYQHTGIVRNHADNSWYFFSNIPEPSGGTVDLANVNIIYDTVRAGALILSNSTVSTSTSTGALRVSGGAGIAGALYIGNTGDVSANIGALFNGNISTNANLGAYQSWANANLVTQTTNINDINANIGAYYTYANANIGTLYLGNISTNANLGAYQTWANANISAQQVEINNIVSTANTNTAAYISTYTGNVSAGNVNVTSNVHTSGILSNTYYGTINIGTTAFDLSRSSGSQTLTGISIDGSASSASTATTATNSVNSGITANTNTGTGYITFVSATSGNNPLYATTSLTFNPATGLLTPYAININGGTASTSTSTGALIVNGGAGVSGNVYSGAVYTSGLYWAGNNVSITGPAGGVSGSITYNNSGSQDGTNIIYDNVSGNVVFTDTTDSTNITTGAVVLKGGIGIAGNAFVGNVLATGFFYANGTPFSSSNYGNVQMLANLAGTTPVTVGGNLTVTGNLSVVGNITSVNYEYVTNTEFANVIVANTINAATIGNTGAVFTGASLSLTNVGDVSANIGTLFLGNTSTQANLGAYQIYANTNAATQATSINSINANLGAYQTYANANVVAIQANLGAYQTWANTSITSLYTSANANTAAYLTTYTGNIQAGNVTVTGNVNVTSNVFANVLYTTNGIRWAGNNVAFTSGGGGGGTFTASNTAPSSPSKGDQWYYIASDILFEYIDDGDSLQWVDTSSPVAPTSTVVSDLVLSNVSISSVYNVNSTKTALGILPTVGTTPPASPIRGDYWYNTNEDILYQYTYDGTSNYWVDVTSETFSSTAGSQLLDTTIQGNLVPSANITYSLGTTTKRFKDLFLSGTTIDLGGATIKTDATSGAIALIPQPTVANPNPTGIVVSPSGTVSTVSTTGGTLTANAISNSSNTAVATNTTTFGNITSNGNVITSNVYADRFFYSNGTAFSSSSFGNTDVAAYMTSNVSGMSLRTDVLSIPVGTTAQRPATASNGALRYNTTRAALETYMPTGGWTILAQDVVTLEYIIVAGGGGGGTWAGGGGGGAGGVLYSASLSATTNAAYTVTVGGGGAAGASSPNGPNGVSGSNSSIVYAPSGVNFVATGGGNGGYTGPTGSSNTGGSGGGATYNVASGSNGIAGQGYAGGGGYSPTLVGGGGGGAGAVGTAGSASGAGPGGIGVSYSAFSTFGSAGYFGGGGGGGNHGNGGNGTGGTGGSGGGANGGAYNVNAQAPSGTQYTGGGGGGAGGQSGVYGVASGAGGSGAVVIRYAGTVQRATGGTVSVINGYTYHYFTATGTFNFTG
jgi:hypothetical protein